MTETLLAITIFTLLSLFFGMILGFAAIKFQVKSSPIVEQLDQLLPQTQCGQCGYPGCKPYAQAVADGDLINKCVPGGESTMRKIADLLGVEPQPMGEDAEQTIPTKRVAFIHEDLCIGCTKCIQACPVDAIIGSTKAMHTIIANECTGCDLCVAPCPTNCIEMIPVATTIDTWRGDISDLIIPVNVVE